MLSLDFLQQMQIEQGAVPTYGTAIDNFGQDYSGIRTTRRPMDEGVLSEDEYSVITLNDKQTLAGYAYLKWNEKVLEIRDFKVTNQYRRRGLGDLLLRGIVEWAKERDVIKVWGDIAQEDLTNSPFLLEWYQRRGFSIGASEDRAFLPGNSICSVLLEPNNWIDPKFSEKIKQEKLQSARPYLNKNLRKSQPKYKYPFGRD